MAIKWTKEDVIKKFQAAMTETEPGTEQGPKSLKSLMDSAKAKITGKPAKGEEKA